MNPFRMYFEGTHGTSLTVARKIEGGEPFESHEGRRGKGAYFWMKCDYAFSLAKAWWLFRCRDKGGAAEPGAVLWVGFEADEDDNEVFDLVSNKEHINRLLSAIQYKRHILKYPKQIAQFYIDFFRMLDSAGVKVKVVICTIAPPDTWEYSAQLLGAPIGYVVRDTAIIKWLRTSPL